MNILILVAHGSRLQESNEEIINFSKKIKNNADENTIIKYAFLELAEPNIYETLEKVNLEYKNANIKILPYFLAYGKHVKVDIPNEVKKFQENHKNTKITILPHIGKYDGLVNLILENIN